MPIHKHRPSVNAAAAADAQCGQAFSLKGSPEDEEASEPCIKGDAKMSRARSILLHWFLSHILFHVRNKMM